MYLLTLSNNAVHNTADYRATSRGRNVQALQYGCVTATRGRGVAMDEEKDQRDCSHPRGHMTSMLTESDARRRSRKRGMAYGGDVWEKCGGGW